MDWYVEKIQSKIDKGNSLTLFDLFYYAYGYAPKLEFLVDKGQIVVYDTVNATLLSAENLKRFVDEGFVTVRFV